MKRSSRVATAEKAKNCCAKPVVRSSSQPQQLSGETVCFADGDDELGRRWWPTLDGRWSSHVVDLEAAVDRGG